MNIYRLEWTPRPWTDSYVFCFVVAEDVEQAKRIHPDGESEVGRDSGLAWARSLSDIKVTLIGVADKSIRPGLLNASYHTY